MSWTAQLPANIKRYFGKPPEWRTRRTHKKIMALYAQGLQQKVIGKMLGLSAHAVHKHVHGYIKCVQE